MKSSYLLGSSMPIFSAIVSIYLFQVYAKLILVSSVLESS